MMRKSPFLLLEVLIAFTLVALCVLPFLYPHFYMIKSEKEFVKEVELDRVANLVFADIYEKLYKNEIPWDTIKDKSASPLNSVELQRLGMQGEYHFEEFREKNGKKEAQTYYWVKLMLSFSPRNSGNTARKLLKYEYDLFIERQLKAGQEGIDKKQTKLPKKNNNDSKIGPSA